MWFRVQGVGFFEFRVSSSIHPTELQECLSRAEVTLTAKSDSKSKSRASAFRVSGKP